MKYLTFVLLTLPLAFNSCLEKDVEAPEKKTPSCVINKVTEEDGNYLRLEYDNNHRIVKAFEFHDNKEVLVRSIVYASDKITTVDYDNKEQLDQTNDTTVYNIVNGKIISSSSFFQYSSFSPAYRYSVKETGKYEYNSDGYLIKVTLINSLVSTAPDYVPINGTSFITYKYNDGNVISMDINDDNDNGNDSHISETYDYYTDKPALISDFPGNVYERMACPHAKNLLKKKTATDYRGVTSEDYTYIFNAQGLPVTIGVVARDLTSGDMYIEKKQAAYQCDK